MTFNIIRFQPTVNHYFLLILLFQLFLMSCENATPPADTEKEVSTDLPTLPDTIGQTVATEHIRLFEKAHLDKLNRNFFFGGELKDSFKVISLKLDAAQEISFFDRLKTIKQDSTQEVLLRIHMALNAKLNIEAVFDKPNLVPLLELIVDQEPEGIYYPLRSFDSPFLTHFDQLYGWQTDSLGCRNIDNCGEALIRVDASCVKELVYNWDSISTAGVTKQLYFNQNTDSLKNRIKYYTFDAENTNEIYEYQQKMEREKKPCFLYIHLGQLKKDPSCVPLRTILHVDDNPIDSSHTLNRAADNAAYFEFAKPCPPACDTSNVVQLR